jgi:quercetin dioxygenase-like cupin family protein
MVLKIEPVTRPAWTPLPYEGCHGVLARGLLRLEHLGLALLRFEPRATIHEHPAPMEIDVICLEGAGFTSVGGEAAAIRAGERVRWPAGLAHRLWTEESAMMTLMVEHVGQPAKT